jgi:hypothetical protein
MYIGCGPADDGVPGYVVFVWLSNYHLVAVCCDLIEQ